MTPVASAQQMREIDRKTIDEWGLPGLALMETAGAAVCQNILAEFAPLETKRIHIFCGKGNNGGDGLVLARMLLNKGANVEVIHSHNEAEMSPDAKFNFSLLEKMGFKCNLFNEIDQPQLLTSNPDLIVDALLGTGINGPVQGLFAEIIHVINQIDAPTYSIDLPSGMNADSAILEGPFIKADKTICIGSAKPSCLYSPTRELVGRLIVESIGFPKVLLDEPKQFWVQQKSQQWKLARKQDSHKGNSGRLLIFAGSLGMAGAGILCAKAAIKSGAAMVQIACPPELAHLFQKSCPEAMVLSLDLNENGELNHESSFELIQQRCHQWADAVVIGPGLGTDESTCSLIKKLLKYIDTPIVLDADGLNALNGNTSILKHRNNNTIITPHPGEFKRLFKESPQTNGQPLLEQCSKLALENRIILHLKGAPSLTASDHGKVFINGSGNSILSTAGSGDVLAGLTGALLAQQFTPIEAMCAAAFWHGSTAELLKNERGMIGHSAMDLVNTIPSVLND